MIPLDRVGLGTSAIGGPYTELSDDTAESTLDAAWQAGTRYFDTAPHYGAGVAERRLGTFLRSRPRDSPDEVAQNAAYLASGVPSELWAELDAIGRSREGSSSVR